jgi:hypothetical protein
VPSPAPGLFPVGSQSRTLAGNPSRSPANRGAVISGADSSSPIYRLTRCVTDFPDVQGFRGGSLHFQPDRIVVVLHGRAAYGLHDLCQESRAIRHVGNRMRVNGPGDPSRAAEERGAERAARASILPTRGLRRCGGAWLGRQGRRRVLPMRWRTPLPLQPRLPRALLPAWSTQLSPCEAPEHAHHAHAGRTRRRIELHSNVSDPMSGQPEGSEGKVAHVRCRRCLISVYEDLHSQIAKRARVEGNE